MKLKKEELFDKRTACSKTYMNEDHSLTTEIFLEEVHYQDIDGSWKEMDDTLIEEGTGKMEVSQTQEKENQEWKSGYVNQKGNFQVHFKKHATEMDMISMKAGKQQLSWGIEGAAKVKAIKTGNACLTYPEVLPGVSLLCTVHGKKIKEDLTLTEALETGKIAYVYQMKNLSPVLAGNKVVFKDGEGQEAFSVCAPCMYDAEGNESVEISLKLVQEKSGVYKVEFVPDKAWLEAPERVFPVTIDPVTTTSKSAADIQDSYVDSQFYPDTHMVSETIRTGGGNAIKRSFLKFQLPTLGAGDSIVNARMVLVNLSTNGASRTIHAHRILQDWSSATLNWKNKPIYDDVVQDACTFTANEVKYVTMDITRLVMDWYNNGKNYGVMLRDSLEISSSTNTDFLSSDTHNDFQDYRPRIEISYMNGSGLEDYWNYHTQSVGRAGNVYINDFNGNQVLEIPLAGTGGSRMPAQAALYYNSSEKDVNIGYGYGFRLNYHQKLENVTIAGTQYYKYTDGEGTVHYFYHDTQESKWKEESGLQLELDLNSESQRFIKDKEDNRLYFSTSGNLVKIQDRNGNDLQITYSGNVVQKVTDGAGKRIQFTYVQNGSGTAKGISSVTDPVGRTKTFTYSSEDVPASMSDHDNAVSTYVFNSRHLLTEVSEPYGRSMKYTFSTLAPYRVIKIREYAGNVEGQRLELKYGSQSTRITDKQGRSMIYEFNRYGNLLYVLDDFGHACAAKYAGIERKTNRLDAVTMLQSNVVQLLRDPLGLDAQRGWTAYKSASDQMTVGECSMEGYYMTGDHSLMVCSQNIEEYAFWQQDAAVKRGETYTFSAYVRGEIRGLTSSSRCGLRVRYMDAGNQARYLYGTSLKKTTDGFVRLGCTFTLPEDASSETVRVYLIVYHANATLYFDMAQLEPGTTANRCNLVYNGDFHLGTLDGFTTENTFKTDGVTETDKAGFIPAMANLMVSSASAPLRMSPSSGSTLIANHTKGTHLVARALIENSEGESWYSAKASTGNWGYVPYSNVQVYDGGGNSVYNGIVTSGNATLRTGASGSATAVDVSIDKGTMVTIKGSSKDASGAKWYRVGFSIALDRYTGYIHQDLIAQLGRTDSKGTVSENTSYYTSPSTGASRGASVSRGTVLDVRGMVNKANGEEWFAVLNNGVYYYLPVDKFEKGVSCETSRRSIASAGGPVGGLEKHVYKMMGWPATVKKVKQTILMQGREGDVFMVNAWAKASALPTENTSDEQRKFGVEVSFVAAGGTEDTHYVPFNPEIQDWQFLSDICVANQDYEKVTVAYVYSHNANAVFFDGLSLFLETFGQTYKYDGEGNVISVEDAAKKKAEFTYNANNDMTGLMTPRGNSYTYSYDSKHNVTRAVSAEHVAYDFSYDQNGNIVGGSIHGEALENSGLSYSRTMTADGKHVASATDVRGNTVHYQWDNTRDLMTSMTDADGNVTNYSYDALDRLASVTQMLSSGGNGVSNSFTYLNDRLQKIRHNGFDYAFTYNGFGAQTGVSAGGTNLVTYTYESGNGKLLKTIYGNGDEVRYAYDGQDRVAESYYKKHNTSTEILEFSYSYNKMGELNSVTAHQAGKTYHLAYDFLGRLMGIMDEDGIFSEYSYDVENNLTRIHHAAGKNVTTEYTYDGDGRECSVRINSQKNLTTVYDVCGRVMEKFWNNITPADMAYEYSSQSGMLPSAVRQGGATTFYEYDGNGNIVSMTHYSSSAPDAVITHSTYVYDGLNRLIRENLEGRGLTITYTYNAGGNLTSVKEYPYTTGTITGTPTRTITGTYPTNGWKDQLLSWDGVSMTYDNCGNMLTKGNTTYTWGSGRKLVGVTENENSIQYQYDHKGMRVKKAVNGAVTEYRYAGTLLLSQKNPDGSEYYFQYDSAGNAAALVVGNATYLYKRNLQGDIIGIIDSNGNEVVLYEYDSWGKILSVSGSQRNTLGQYNPLRYRGYYYDAETGLYYLGERYYDQEIKRFISSDQLAEYVVPSMANLYVYCRNNPILYTDVLGMFPILACITDKKIHNFVLQDIVESEKNRTLSMKKTTLYVILDGVETMKVWRYCDLFDVETGETWELKKMSDSPSCRTENARKQLNQYCTGTFKYYPDIKPHLPSAPLIIGKRYKPNMLIGNKVYNISYWEEGNGILRYDYDEFKPKYDKVTHSIGLYLTLGLGLIAGLLSGGVGYGLGLGLVFG